MDGYNETDAINLLRSFTRHLAFVREGIHFVTVELERRALVHDASKLLDDEFSGFSRINAAARINKFGSPEYKAGMQQERPTIDLHFSRNSHHPERPMLLADSDGQSGMSQDRWDEVANANAMTFLDVIEMVCDWWGARKGYDDPRSWADTVKLNFEQKGKYLSPEQLWLARSVAEFLGRCEARR